LRLDRQGSDKDCFIIVRKGKEMTVGMADAPTSSVAPDDARRRVAESILAGLNPPQAEAVRHGDGPVLVVAGAGSGKTRVLTRRVAYLIQVRDVAPWRIMAVTFTNKAAGEMRHRVLELVGPRGQDVTIGTFHSICARILRRELSEVGAGNFSIYDSDDQRALIKQALEMAGISDNRLTPVSALARISALKSELVSPAAFQPDGYFDSLIKLVYPVYEGLLRSNQALDFDDLLVKTVELLRDRPGLREKYSERYRHVLVDEYQDTNHVQYMLVSIIGERHRNVFAVGDPDQAIYGWRGADVRNIVDFEAQFPESKVITLDQNYRSSQNILDAAHAVIAVNEERHDKKLWTQRDRGSMLRVYEASTGEEEAQFIVREARRLISRGTPDARSIAVMYRTNAQSRTIEDTFVREGLPYRIVGSVRFYARREVRDVLAYLRFLANPSDAVSLERIIGVPPRKIGDTTIRVLTDWATSSGKSLWAAMNSAEQIEQLASAPRNRLASAVRIFSELLSFAETHNVTETLEHVIAATGYLDWLTRQERGEERIENVRELASVAQVYEHLDPAESLRAMLEQTALVGDADQIDENASVTLMTMHLAKGLEFDAVFLAGLEEGIFPHARSLDSAHELEEERRLCYVGITRARHRLYLTHAMRRMLMGRVSSNDPSRFLANVPRELLSPDSNASWLGEASSRRAAHFQVAPPAPQSISEQSFWPGEKVYHKIFGVGTVVESTVKGGDEEVSVEFKLKGAPVTKKLSVMYSGIEHA
jgi:DNA helicase-2/ATP-dependent DNA helicase PcrA